MTTRRANQQNTNLLKPQEVVQFMFNPLNIRSAKPTTGRTNSPRSQRAVGVVRADADADLYFDSQLKKTDVHMPNRSGDDDRSDEEPGFDKGSADRRL
jgi:hypothetical protein